MTANRAILSDDPAADAAWRASLLRYMVIASSMGGTFLLAFVIYVNDGFASSARGIITETLVVLLWTATLLPRLPERFKLAVLLTGLFSMGTLNIIDQGPVVLGVMLPFTLLLLLALFYWNVRGVIIAGCVVAIVYVIGAYGWIRGYFPWNYVQQRLDPHELRAWIRVTFGQLMVSMAFTAIVYYVIAHSHRSLRALRTSEERARLLIEHAPEAIVVLDVETQKFIVANPAAQSLFGLSLEALLNKSPLDVSPVSQPDGRPSIEAAAGFIGAAVNGTAITFEWAHRNSEGREIFCEVRLLRLPDSKRVLVRGSILDLSERKRTERALRALSSYDASITGPAFFKACAEQLARGLAMRCALIAVLFEHDGKRHLSALAFWPDDSTPSREYAVENTAAAEVLGGRALHIDRGVTARFPGDALLKEFSADSYLGVPIVDAAADIIGLVAVFDDKAMPDSAAAQLLLATTASRIAAEIVRLKAAEAVLELNAALERRVAERTAELTATNAELESFTYSVSHDLRAPLRNIEGYSAAMQQDCAAQLNGTGRDYLSRIRSVTQRMHQLIDDMLRLSQTARAAVNLQRIDLIAIALDINKEFAEREPDRKVEFIHPAQLQVQADPQLTRIVLTNLLDNAWKYTGGRSVAQIELGIIAAPNAHGSDVYYIRDNGAGFDMSDAGKLFTPFQRLHKQHEYQGTGIGLATVQRIIARHGGHVWLESVPDAGTTVYFTLNDGDKDSGHSDASAVA